MFKEFFMDILSKFGEVLSNLMFEREINMSELAKELDLDQSTISNYINGKRLPAIENLIAIADYFNCTTDFLLGRESDNYSTTFYKCPPFSEQLKVLKTYFKCPWQRFYQSADITSSCFYEWRKGTFSPSLDSIISLADGFKCSVDFILGRSKH